MHELLIAGGIVFDGLGSQSGSADVAVDDGRVVAIGRDLGPARRTIQVGGHAVAPGFVDAHAHSDAVPFMDHAQPFKLLQGVTTEVVGNCGFSAAPMTEASAEHARAAWGAFLHADAYRAGSFAAYLDRVQEAGPTNHLAPMVGHGTLRLAANGVGQELRDGAIEDMCARAEEAFAAGAAGLSSGLIYVPGTWASTDEVVALATVAARWRRPYATHMRDEGDRLEQALDEAIEIGRRSGARVQISHCKSAGARNRGKGPMLLARLHAARQAGVDIRGDQYPYTAGSTFLVALLPTELSDGGVDELRRRCQDPDAVRLLEFPLWEPTTPDATVLIEHVDPSVIGLSLSAIAERRGLDPVAALCALVAEDPGAMIVLHSMHVDDVREIMADPLIGIGSDNAAPQGTQHPRTWGCFPEFLGRYVRELGVVSLEEGIRKATSATAFQFDLAHRGTLQPGSIADICVFDPDAIAHPGTYTEPSLRPTGIDHVVLAGRVVVDQGEFTGERAGVVIRQGHPESVAAK